MKIPPAKSNGYGFTLIEVLVIILIIFILAAMIGVPGSRVKQKAKAAQCMNNQRQIAIGLLLFQGDDTNQNHFPWQISNTNNGSMEEALVGGDAANFNALYPYLRQARVFLCPTDPLKVVMTNGTRLSNQNISYFVGLDAGTNAPWNILTGDRHLLANLAPIKPGLFVYTSDMTMNWSTELHGQTSFAPWGMVSFGDGHVEAVRNTNIDLVFRREGLTTSRFDIP